MLAIKTIDKLPDGCYDNCICCHDGWCYAIHTGDGTNFDYQAAQQIRPYNCPLELIRKNPLKSTINVPSRGDAIVPSFVIDGKRIYIRYGEDGGKEREGTIELRRDIKDIHLHNALYSMVKIIVKQDPNANKGTHYLRGMAFYSDDVPPGYDIVFNTSKPKGTEIYGTSPDISVFKPIK